MRGASWVVLMMVLPVSMALAMLIAPGPAHPMFHRTFLGGLSCGLGIAALAVGTGYARRAGVAGWALLGTDLAATVFDFFQV